MSNVSPRPNRPSAQWPTLGPITRSESARITRIATANVIPIAISWRRTHERVSGFV